MAKPKKRVVPSGSLLAIIDAFLDWCQKHRAPDTYEWYQSRLELFAQKHPQLRAADLRPFHVQQWIDAMVVSSGTKRNYCRTIKRCMAWAKKQGHIDLNPIVDLEQPRGGKREVVVAQEEFDELLALPTDLVGDVNRASVCFQTLLRGPTSTLTTGSDRLVCRVMMVWFTNVSARE